MTDTIEAVALAVNQKRRDWGGPTEPVAYDRALAQAAIAAHTKALIEGAGDVVEGLLDEARIVRIDGAEEYARMFERYAATLSALQAENARAKEERVALVRAGIDAAAEGLEEAYFINFWRVDGMNVTQARIHAKTKVQSVIRALDPAAIAHSAALSDLIAADAHLIDGEQ